MKPVARLTGAILARKGFATPSIGLVPEPGGSGHIVDPDPNFGKQEHMAKMEPGERDSVRSEVGVSQPPVSARRQSEPVAAGVPAAEKKRPTATSKARRIAMTVRMNEEQHLKLKVYCAHHRKSAQKIIMEAIGNFMARHESDDELAGCNCFLTDYPDR